MGWTTALLGIVQIPLGLTLYGSPLSLFILYALAVFGLLVTYFVLSFLHARRKALDYDAGSYTTGPEVIDDRSSHGPGGGLAAAGVGAAMLGNRFRRGPRSRSSFDGTSERTPYVEEKHSENQRSGGWTKKLFKLGGLAGVAGAAHHFMRRRRDRESDNESGRYRPADTATESFDDDYSVSRVEEGRPPLPPPVHAQRRRYDGPPSLPQSQYTESEITHRDERGHGPRNTFFGAGILGGLKGLFKSRAAREEERRLEEIRQADLQSERMMRERRYTGGDRMPRRNDRRYASVSEITGPTDTDVLQSGVSDLPPPSPGRHELSGSDTVTSLAHDQHKPGAISGPSQPHRFAGAQDDSVESPPVSIKVDLHNNGRRVTLRQLTREEAEANREARRKERTRPGRRRRESSLSGGEGDNHWRRVEELERRQAEEMRNTNASIASAGPSAPPPPAPPHTEPAPPATSGLTAPVPPPTIPAAGIHSPLASTDLSGSFASRSGRRRAERRTQRQGGSRVEFT